MIRVQLQAKLALVCQHVYYQPSSNITLQYPCIIYEKIGNEDLYGNNNRYSKFTAYQVMVISRDPDDPICDNLEKEVPYTDFSRHFIADGLHHYVYTVYN